MADLYNWKRMSEISGLFSSINWHWAWLIVATFLAGGLNAVAGGGSFLSFPALLGMGIQPIQANATNTIALWPGQIFSIAAYWPNVRKNVPSALLMGAAGLVGGTTGAEVLLHTPQRLFMQLVPWLLLVAAMLFAISGPVSRWLERRKGRMATPPKPKRLLLFLAVLVVSFYVGYFGAGAGFLFITVLALFGYQDMHLINALKVVANSMANGIAFVVFVTNNQVVWRYCLLAMIACAIGGYTTARLAPRVPQPVMRGIVVAVGLSMAAWFFYKQ